MRGSNRTGRLTLAIAAALLAGLLTAWVEPSPRQHDELRREIVEMARAARGAVEPSVLLAQPLPLARTIVSNNQ